MLVAVCAGTPVDTELGCDLVKNSGFEVLPYPVAKSPKEQDKLQFLDKEILEKKVESIIDDAKKMGASCLFIYCNSLSTAIDYKMISKRKNFKIITPLEIYEKYARMSDNLVVISANSQSAHGIENALKKANLNLNLITIGILPVVVEIEAKKDPKDIIDNLALERLFKFLEDVRIGDGEKKSIVLGCTHFPYLKEEIKKITKLEILDPADGMIDELKKINL